MKKQIKKPAPIRINRFGQPLVHLTVDMPQKLVRKLDGEAESLGVTRTEQLKTILQERYGK